MRDWLRFGIVVAVILAIAAAALVRLRHGRAYGQISLKDHTREEAVRLWLDRIERDHKSDWKTPIAFYGRIVDQQMLPVPDAQVHFQWTDLSTKGSSEADTVTDRHGSFTLQGVEGKRLGVSAAKSGYYNPLE
jgi:hypothetical protein